MGRLYIAGANEGHEGADHLYLVTKDLESYYKPKFIFEEGEMPCDMELFIQEGGRITFLNTDDKDRVVAYFSCDGKRTYIMGLKINHESFKTYEDVYGERR